MRQRDRDEVLVDGEYISLTANGTTIDLGAYTSHPVGFSLFGKLRKVAEDAIFIEFASDDVDIDDDTITVENHGFTTGQSVYYAASTSTIVGIVDYDTASDIYYVIKVDDDTIQLAASKANALAGTDIDLTNAGEGEDHYIAIIAVTPDMGVKLQVSIDNDFFVDLPSSSTAVTDDTDIFWEDVDMMYRYVRPVFTVTAGDILVDMKFLVIREM